LVQIEAMADQVVDTLSKEAGLEIPSQHIGELVMEVLKPLDRVAYVRFASVYRDFQGEDEFQEFVREMKERGVLEAQRRGQSELPLFHTASDASSS
jgi:transcriptional regulator NrdR family protein